MFRSHKDTIRNPIEVDKCKADPIPKIISGGYKCDMCDKTWLTETDVDIHKKMDHLAEIISSIKNEKDHNICLTCVRPQGSPENLISHIKTEHLLSSPTAVRVEREIFICDHCQNVFFNKKLITSHMQYMHRGKLKSNILIPCPKCSKSYKCYKMWFHFNFHQLNESLTCQICMLLCAGNNEKIDHLKTHSRYYHCDICNITMNKKQFFDEHISVHKKRAPQIIGGNLNRFFVPWSSVTPWKYRMGNGVHGVYIYDLSICIICREICKTAEEKRRHILVDHAPEREVKQKPMCACGEEFFNMVLLKHHIFKLKGDHRIMEDNEILRQQENKDQELFDNPLLEDCEENIVEIPIDRGLFENPSPMDCDLFTVQDLEAE